MRWFKRLIAVAVLSMSTALAGGGGDIGNAVVGAVADARGKGIPILYIAPAGLYDAASPTAARRGS